jgi:hypothetical protein
MTMKNETVTRIAQTYLRLETLETRKSDSLDFHNLAVWQIKVALEAAYEAGHEAGLQRSLKVIEETLRRR